MCCTSKYNKEKPIAAIPVFPYNNILIILQITAKFNRETDDVIGRIYAFFTKTNTEAKYSKSEKT